MTAKKHLGLRTALRDVRELPPPVLKESDLKPLSEIQPLKFAAMRYAYRALKTNNFHRTQTAKDLNVSLRVLRNYIADMRRYGWELPPLCYHNPNLDRPRLPRKPRTSKKPKTPKEPVKSEPQKEIYAEISVPKDAFVNQKALRDDTLYACAPIKKVSREELLKIYPPRACDLCKSTDGVICVTDHESLHDGQYCDRCLLRS